MFTSVIRKTPPYSGETLAPRSISFYLLSNDNCMSTFRQIFYHLVFSTRNREATLPQAHQVDLYKYIWGVVKKHHCTLYQINGMEDHLHIFSDLHPSVSLANFIKDIKLSSSEWMKGSGLFPRFTRWQDGYGAFTHSEKDRDRIIAYIKGQKEHHRHESFPEEYRRLLIEHQIPFEERFLL